MDCTSAWLKPKAGHGLTMGRQPGKKKGKVRPAPKRKVGSGRPRRIACTTPCGETADEKRSGNEVGWTGVDREGGWKNQMRPVRNTQAHCQ